MGSKVVKNFLDTIPEQLFLCQQFSIIDPSAYDLWAGLEALSISNPPYVSHPIFKRLGLKLQHNRTIHFELRAPFRSPSCLDGLGEQKQGSSF